VTGTDSILPDPSNPRRPNGRLIRGKPAIKDPIELPGHRADGQPTHLHPRLGGRRAGSGRKPSGAPSNEKFLRVTCTLAPRHIALLLWHRETYKEVSLSEALRTILDEWVLMHEPLNRAQKTVDLLDEWGAHLAPAHAAAYARFEQAEEERLVTEDTR
jgi:hypothetical protein